MEHVEDTDRDQQVEIVDNHAKADEQDGCEAQYAKELDSTQAANQLVRGHVSENAVRSRR